MRIKLLNKLLEAEAQDHILKDCSLVIDAQNYFYNMYAESGLSSEAGCESNRFSTYLKRHLTMFKKANVKCYFVFKGGSKDIQKRWEKLDNRGIWLKSKVTHVFVKDICRQVLEEMGFDYVICPFEAKQQCAVLANKLECPVVSNDIEVGIISDSYINSTHIKFTNVYNGLQCKLFRFSNFLEKFQLSREIFSIFVLLTDRTMYPEGYFSEVLRKINAPEILPTQYFSIFTWLSSTSKSEAINKILERFNPEERETIMLKEKEICCTLLTPQSPDIPCQYFLEKNEVSITNNDPKWFEKGVALGHVAIPYINLYTDGVIDGSWEFNDLSMPDASLLSTEIIRYALNLLSNYSRDSFVIRSDNGNKIKVDIEMPGDIPKLNYTENNGVFENGWTRIGQLNLLKHFLNYTVRGVDFDLLQKLPKDATVLMMALIYMAHKSPVWGECEAYSVLVSFVLCSNNVNMNREERQKVAEAVGSYAFKNIQVDKDLIYPLFQFQYCLEQMNFLNALCGFTYKPTIYSKTYNGRLVYNIRRKLLNSEMNAFTHIMQLLGTTPTVAALFKRLVDVHKKIMPFKN